MNRLDSLGQVSGEILQGIRFFLGVPGFLRNPLTEAKARAVLQERLANREGIFLRLVRSAIYAFPESAYGRLLAIAGCQYGDLEQLVRADGVEGALNTLYLQGVYLTVDEFKGRRSAVRGSAILNVDPTQLRNPLTNRPIFVRTSASGGMGTPVPLDLASQRDRAVNIWLALAARGGLEWIHGVWAVPGSTGAGKLLAYAAFGQPPARWFSQVDPTHQGLHPRYAWSGRLLRWGSFFAGSALPAPEYVPVEDPRPVARWMRDVLQAGQIPHAYTFSSAAARLAVTAWDSGIDISGAQLTISGEPLTEARLAVIKRSRVQAVANYGSAETGVVGEGCLAPIASDDVHVYHDLHAVIQPGSAADSEDLPPSALLITTLHPTAPFVFLNFSPGDQAVREVRDCGCPMAALGWTTHLHTVRSFEKLTAGGMTFLDRDVIRVLEETLPARFGGGPTDYQLVEEEGQDGDPRLRLFVHPAIGPIDEEAVVDTFLASIGQGSGAQRVMELMWRNTKFVRIERRPPIVSGGGKVLHLHRTASTRPSG